MTKKQLETLLAGAILQRDRAQKMIREHFDDLEKNNKNAYWTNIYLTNKALAEWVRKQKPDDE